MIFLNLLGRMTNMDNIKNIIQVGIFVPIMWVVTRNIVFAKKRDEREISAIFNAMKTTVISTVFVIGLIIILNLLNGITSISTMCIFIIALIACIYFIFLYKLNLNSKFSFLDFLGKIEKKQKSDFIWNIFCITMVTELLALIGIFISYKYFDLRGLKILTIVAYVLAFISDYCFCKINVEGI